MSAIGRVPRGLLDFFRIQSTGRNPQALGETIAPTLDMLGFYAGTESGDTSIYSLAIDLTDPVGTLYPLVTQTYGIDLGSPVVVPQNEVWLMLTHNVGTLPTTTAGNIGVTALALTPPNYAGVAPWIVGRPTDNFSTQTNVGLSWQDPAPIWIPPNWQPHVMLTGVSLGAVDSLAAEVLLRIQRFHI